MYRLNFYRKLPQHCDDISKCFIQRKFVDQWHDFVAPFMLKLIIITVFSDDHWMFETWLKVKIIGNANLFEWLNYFHSLQIVTMTLVKKILPLVPITIHRSTPNKMVQDYNIHFTNELNVIYFFNIISSTPFEGTFIDYSKPTNLTKYMHEQLNICNFFTYKK